MQYFRLSAFLFISTLLTLSAQDLAWEEIQPTGLDGVTSVQAISGHDGQLYLTAALSEAPFRAVFRSSDGVAWTRLFDGEPTRSQLTLADGDILFYDENSWNVVVQDGGSYNVKEIAPAEGSGVFAAAEGNGSIVLGGFRGSRRADPAWWVSRDGGDTFTYYEGESRIGDVNVTESIKGLAYGNGTFVATGYPGEVWTSTTGETWVQTPLPKVTYGGSDQDLMLFDVVFRNGEFFAVGYFLSVYKSTNGTDWTQVHMGNQGYALEKLVIDGDDWYAGGSNGGQAFSTDGGVTWYSGRYGSTSTADVTGGNGLFYGARYFVPAGSYMAFGSRIAFDWYPGGNPVTGYAGGTWVVYLNGAYFRGTKPASFLDAATTADGVYFEHPWLGWYSLPDRGWFFHYNMGWLFSSASDGNAVWMFSPDLGWIFTNQSLWPYFFHGASGDWGFDEGGGEWFWNETRGEWQPRNEFGKGPWVVSADWLIGKTLTIVDGEGTHTLQIVSDTTVNATFNVKGKQLTMTTADTTTWFDSSFAAALPEGRRFTFDIADATAPGIGDRVFPLVLTFDGPEGGTSQMTYTYMKAFLPYSGTNIMGTFTVQE